LLLLLLALLLTRNEPLPAAMVENGSALLGRCNGTFAVDESLRSVGSMPSLGRLSVLVKSPPSPSPPSMSNPLGLNKKSDPSGGVVVALLAVVPVPAVLVAAFASSIASNRSIIMPSGRSYISSSSSDDGYIVDDGLPLLRENMVVNFCDMDPDVSKVFFFVRLLLLSTSPSDCVVNNNAD